MADLKPLGSEKLSSDEKLKRILELTYYNNTKTSSSNKNKAELVKESKNGGIYGIVKEKDGYYVKRGLNENSLDYIGGMFMKNKNKFNSYAEALKRLELLKGQEELNEATKYVLKTNSPKEEGVSDMQSSDVPSEPVATDEPSVPSEPSSEPVSDVSPSLPDTDDEMGSESKRSDYMAEVQKFAGKLGQELRDQQDKMESDDIKYVLNMIISAVDLDKLDLEDIEEIGKKFERDEDEMGDEEVPAEEPEMGDEEVPAEEPPAPEEDLGEMDVMDALENFINTPVDQVDELMTMSDMGFDDEEEEYSGDREFEKLAQRRFLELSQEFGQEEARRRLFKSMSNLEKNTPKESDIEEIDLSSYADIDETSHEDELKEIDLDQIKNEINQSVGETLSKYFN